MMSFAGDAGDCGVSFTTTRKNGRDSDSLNIGLETSPAIPRIPRSRRPVNTSGSFLDIPHAGTKRRESCIDLFALWTSLL
jgi:hypothetical protein